jgi:hypothetical protein
MNMPSARSVGLVRALSLPQARRRHLPRPTTLAVSTVKRFHCKNGGCSGSRWNSTIVGMSHLLSCNSSHTSQQHTRTLALHAMCPTHTPRIQRAHHIPSRPPCVQDARRLPNALPPRAPASSPHTRHALRTHMGISNCSVYAATAACLYQASHAPSQPLVHAYLCTTDQTSHTRAVPTQRGHTHNNKENIHET